MNKSLLRKVTVGITVIGLGLFAAGCSSDGDDSPTTPSNETNAQSSETNPFNSDSSGDNAGTDKEDADAEAPANNGDGGSSDALSTYVETVKEQSKQMLDSMGGIYSDIEIRAVQPSTMEYVYTYAQQVPTDQARDELVKQGESLQSLCNSAIYSEMERFEISDPAVKFTYLNADSSDIWSYTCE